MLTDDMSIFSAVKILDLSRVFSGPFATLQLANFGAQVTKIEPPTGDDSRQFPPKLGKWSGYFEVLNHNKSSLVLDLKNDADLQKFYELCTQADVIVENFSSAVTHRLKISYEDISQINPSIIFASLSGISHAVERKYYDVIAQAESGFASLNGETSDMKVATSVVDAFSGMKLAFAIASALYAREKTGKGTHIHVSMKGSAFDLLEQNLIETSVTKKDPKKVGNMDSAIAPFGFFQAQDGMIALAIGNQKLWELFVSFLQHHTSEISLELFTTNTDRVANIETLKIQIEAVFAHFSRDELFNELNQLSIPVGKVQTLTEVLADQENFEQGLLEKVECNSEQVVIPAGGISFSHFPKEKYLPAPALNDTDDSI